MKKTTKALNAKAEAAKIETAMDGTLFEDDFAPDECRVKLQPAQVAAVVNMTHRRAVMLRSHGRWSEAEESAFFNGAMSALLACRNNAEIPAYWIFGNKTGGSILDLLSQWKKEGQPLSYAKRRRARAKAMKSRA